METYCWLTLPVAGCRVAAHSLHTSLHAACVCRLWAVTQTASRLSFSDESALKVYGIHDDALYKLMVLLLLDIPKLKPPETELACHVKQMDLSTVVTAAPCCCFSDADTQTSTLPLTTQVWRCHMTASTCSAGDMNIAANRIFFNLAQNDNLAILSHSFYFYFVLQRLLLLFVSFQALRQFEFQLRFSLLKMLCFSFMYNFRFSFHPLNQP